MVLIERIFFFFFFLIHLLVIKSRIVLKGSNTPLLKTDAPQDFFSRKQTWIVTAGLYFFSGFPQLGFLHTSDSLKPLTFQSNKQLHDF